MTTQGLSHIVLTAPSRELQEKTVQFYMAVGFELVKESDSRNLWLTIFGESSCIIKIALGNSDVLSQQAAADDDSDWRLSEKQICITVQNISILEQTLSTIKSLYQKHFYSKADPNNSLSIPPPESETHTEILTHDPLNNLVVFTNRANPYSKKLLEQIGEATTSIPCVRSASSSGGCGGAAKRKKRIGILTSGGDSPGMNCSVRAVVRTAIARGCEPYAILEGYKGMVEGGESIKKMAWDDVRGYLHIGGTLIGTARCKPFMTRSGRLDAALNLIINGIDAIIVCGGDGSLTGADIFRAEWPGLLAELVKTGRVTKDAVEPYSTLTIVGLVGSIDNDMSSTDITIGAVTSLHRICESLDAITSTALSHSRAFVVEVMGRHCGWLALMAGITSGADFVFIPEHPPEAENWEDEMCNVLDRHRKLGKRKVIVIVSEGAIDKHLQPIKADYVKQILSERLNFDTRVTTLGHVQRGGAPAAYDRFLGTVQGVEAVEAVLRSTSETPSPMIGMRENKLVWEPLVAAVKQTHSIAEAIGRKDFVAAMKLRDPDFAEDYDAFVSSTILDKDYTKLPAEQRLNIAIINIGAPAGGMNAVTRVAVRQALSNGHTPFVIYNGFVGLLQDHIEKKTWISVDGWQSRGGSEIGTNRTQPTIDLGMVAFKLQEHKIQALLLVGGFEAYTALHSLNDNRKTYPAFCIPMVHIPATISNNVPGTDYSLGSDTSLNAIVVACDAIKQSASASRRRVFVVEVQGGGTGYLAVMAGLATGATTVYIPEDGVNLARLQNDVANLVELYKSDNPRMSEGRIILRNETVSKTYTTEVISEIITAEGQKLFDSRTAVLGHTQQGGVPSPLDRIRATRLAVKCIAYIEQQHLAALNDAQLGKIPYCMTDESAAVVGIRGSKTVFTPARELLKETDMKNRKSTHSWWLSTKGLIELLTRKVSHDECNEGHCPILEEVDLMLGKLDVPVRY